jgi:lipopolysaccharide transport protein LptA/LPS export ABC transporter protein LptC
MAGDEPVRDDVDNHDRPASAHNLAVADPSERQRAFRRARMNSVFVRVMRVVLPVTALALLSTYGLFMQHRIRIETGDVVGTLDTGTLSGASLENFTMTRPSYQGYNAKNGSRYHVSAERALTDLTRDKPIELIGISGTLEHSDGRATSIEAARGVFDQKNRTLELDGGISIDAPNDLDVRLNRALVDAANARIVSDAPVAVSMPDGSVRSNAMELDQRQRKILFKEGVEARLNPRPQSPATPPAGAATATPATPATPANSSEPITITSARLSVSESDRTAAFDGNVRASQSGRTLEAPRLTVALAQGGRLPGLPGADTPKSATKTDKRAGVEKIIADQGVVLTDTNAEIRAERAEFDVPANRARLDGSVQVNGNGGATVSADQATVDTKTARVVLDGNVIARQQETLMRGHQLVYEREKAQLILASPAAPGRPESRIFARLKPQQGRNGRRRQTRRASAGGLDFSTNPDAPIEITARSLIVTDTSRTASFTGGVQARQGDFQLTAPTLVAAYSGRLGLDGGQQPRERKTGRDVTLKTIRATGPVKITSANDVAATGQRALYDAPAEKVTLSGNVVLRQGRQIIRGETLTIDLKTGRARVENAGQANITAKPLQHGAAPKVTANPNQRDCGGRMCAVFYPGDLENQRRPKQRPQKTGRTPDIGNGWSTSTRAK